MGRGEANPSGGQAAGCLVTVVGFGISEPLVAGHRGGSDHHDVIDDHGRCNDGL
jgi:hypothetical protein